ncbi:hypothetical protein CF328_g793 [Tilletia controversa]|nr:hypothetical protein CF328_g793 [Tilletia controversa]
MLRPRRPKSSHPTADQHRNSRSSTIYSPALSPERPSDSLRSHFLPSSSFPPGCVAQPYIHRPLSPVDPHNTEFVNQQHPRSPYPILPPSPSSPTVAACDSSSLISTNGTTLPPVPLFNKTSIDAGLTSVPPLSPSTTLVERSFSNNTSVVSRRPSLHSRTPSAASVFLAAQSFYSNNNNNNNQDKAEENCDSNTMSPTFDFNAFINSASPPMSPAAQLLHAQNGVVGVGVGAGTGGVGAGPLISIVHAQTPSFDHAQGANGADGDHDGPTKEAGSLLPAWATVSEVTAATAGPSAQRSQVGPQQVIIRPSGAGRQTSIDAMLFTNETEPMLPTGQQEQQQQQQQQQREGAAATTFYHGSSAGISDIDMIQALGMGPHHANGQMDMSSQQHWTNILQQQQQQLGPGPGPGPAQVQVGVQGFAGPPPMTAPLPQHQHESHPSMHPMPQHFQQQQQQQAQQPQQQMPYPGSIPSYYSSGAIGMAPTPRPVEAYPVVVEQHPAQQVEVLNEAQLQARRAYRAQVAEHHSKFLHHPGPDPETNAEGEQRESKKQRISSVSSSVAAVAAAPAPGPRSPTMSSSRNRGKGRKGGGGSSTTSKFSVSKVLPSGKTTSSGFHNNNSQNGSSSNAAVAAAAAAAAEAAETAAARESVAARVMSWAAGTGGPADGSGGSGEESTTTSSKKKAGPAVSGNGDSSAGPATATANAAAGPAPKKQRSHSNGGTRGVGASGGVHRLSLQERRRLSRLASEATGSDSGGSGGSSSNSNPAKDGNGKGNGSGTTSRSGSFPSQSQSEASGKGVTTTKELPEGGVVAGGPSAADATAAAAAAAGGGDQSVPAKGRLMPERTKRALAAGQAAANAAAEQDSHSSNYNGSKSKSPSSGDEGSKSVASATGSSARAVRESSGEGAATDTDPVFHGPYHEIALTANGKDGPKHVRNSYSSSGFDILGALTKVAARKNPRIQLGPIDLSCAFTVSDALKPDQPLIYVSDTFTRLTGYQPADVLGKNCRFLQAPDGSMVKGAERLNTDGRAVAHMKKHMDRTRECQASLINYKKNGKAFINLVTIVPIPWGDSNVIQYFVGFQVDLVEQPGAILEKDANGQYVVNYTTAGGAPRRSVIPAPLAPVVPDPIKEALEEKARQVNGAHKLAEIVTNGQSDVRPWARLLLDNAQDLIYVLSLKGIFLYVSPSVERILGYKAEELIGRSISEFCHPSDVVPVFRELKDSTSNASIAAAARKSAKALGGYKALTKGGAGQSGPQVNLLLRMRHRSLGHQWIESVGKLHLEQGKGRKVVISSGRARTVYNLSWDQVRRTTDDREPAFWSKVSLDGLVLSSTSRTAAVLGCTPGMLQGQHLMEMCNGEAGPAIVQALRGRSVSMVAHMLHDTVGQGEPVPVISTFYPSVEQALAFGGQDAGSSDELPVPVVADAVNGDDASKRHAAANKTAAGPFGDSTASVFVHIRRATSEMPLEANIAYLDDLQMLKMQAQLAPGSLQTLPSLKAAMNQQQQPSKPILAASDILADPAAVAAATAAAAADLGGTGSVFTELSTYRSSSWVFELHQLKIMNKRLREEVKIAQRQGRLGLGGVGAGNAAAAVVVPSVSVPVPVVASTPAAAAVVLSTPAPTSQQMLAHQHQVAAQAQAMMHNPSHMSSIVGSLNGSSSYMGVPMALEPSNSSTAGGNGGGFPTAQSPTSSIVLPAGGMTMSGRANALAAAGLRRPGIIPMQQPSMHSQPQQQMLPHGVSSFTSSSQMVSFQQQQQPQQWMYSMPMGMHPLAREGSMGVPMDTPSSTGGPGSISSASLFDVYSQQNGGGGGGGHHHHQHLHPHRPSMPGHSGSDFSGFNASGETTTSATSVELSSNGEDSGPGSRSNSSAQIHRPGSSSAEESMKEHKRRVDASTAVLLKAAAAAAAQQQQHLHHAQQQRLFPNGGIGDLVAGRKRSAAGDVLPLGQNPASH